MYIYVITFNNPDVLPLLIEAEDITEAIKICAQNWYPELMAEGYNIRKTNGRNFKTTSL